MAKGSKISKSTKKSKGVKSSDNLTNIVTRGSLRKYLESRDKNKEPEMAEVAEPNAPSQEGACGGKNTIQGDIKGIQETLQVILKKLEPMDNMNQALTELTGKLGEIENNVERNTNRLTKVEGDLEKNVVELEEIKTSLEYSQKDITDLKSRMDSLDKTQTNNESAGVNRLLKQKIQDLELKLADLELHSRRENLIFYGVTEGMGKEDVSDTVYKILEFRLQIPDARQRIKFSRAHRLGKKLGDTKNSVRPIIVKFHYYPDAVEVFMKKRLLWDKTVVSLRNPDIVCKGIGLDFPESVKHKRKYLKQVLKLAKEKDPKAYLQKDRLVYKNRGYTLPECYKITDLDLLQLGTRERQNHVLCYGRFSPYSNFFPAPMEIEGRKFHCVEQFYQYRKASFLHKEQVALDIMLADDPLETKRLGDTLETALWAKEHAVPAMLQGIQNKFEQNPLLNKMLKDTRGKRIVECNAHDSFWGNGTSLKDPRSLQDIGQNLLGVTLMKVRDQL